LQEKAKNLEIKWLFKAHHHKFNTENWKRYVSEGGGVIRFYGIHLIAVLTALGFTLTKSSEVSGYSENELYEWKSTFQNLENGSICTVYVNSNSQENEQFSVSLYDTEQASEFYRIINQASPFGSSHYVKNKIDTRSFILAKYITKAYKSNNEWQSLFYNNVNKLWYEIEEVSYFKK
jgi:predicted dehydrogenase